MLTVESARSPLFSEMQLCTIQSSFASFSSRGFCWLHEHHLKRRNKKKKTRWLLLFSDDFTATACYYANVRHILRNYKHTPRHKMRQLASSRLNIQSWLLCNFSQSRRETGDPEWIASPQSKLRLTRASISLWAGNKQLAHVSWEEMRHLPLL